MDKKSFFRMHYVLGGVKMPNIKSAKKRVLVSEANYEHNKAYRSALKTAVKKAER